MRRLLALMLAAATLNSAPLAQTPSQPTPPPLVLHTSAQLVVVDVVVQDKNGHPLHGLKPEDFRVTEGGVQQKVSHFEEHSSQTPPNPGPTLPPLPPGIFTNYTPMAPDGTLNILLLDALNTPMKDQNFVRYQLQQYVKHANPNTRIAVFGLANRLILLQGFTSDPATLRDVVEHKLIARSSSLLRSPGETIADQQRLSDLATQPPSGTASAVNGSPSASDLAANLRQFEAEMGAMETQLRVQYTLDAFNTLAHYLAAFPGRKNLIWFSGSFPLTILPDPSLARPFAVANTDEDEFRETVNLLSRAQVSVYPIDARGLMTQPTFDATTPGPSHANPARNSNADLIKFAQSQAAEHGTMDELASDTGGRAFYNTNNLAAAVASAIDAGTNYYTLTYSPTNPKEDGSFRQIRVEATGPEAAQHLQLSYRRGYYTHDASQHRESNEPANPSQTAADDSRAAAYKQAAMSRGAPTPEDLIFKVRILPASTTTETAVAPNNTLLLSVSPQGPFRRYDVDYVALPGELTFTQQPDGHRSAKVEFLAYVYDTDGRLLDATGSDVSIEATTANYAKLMHSIIKCDLEVSVPDRAQTFIRIGVRDVTTNKFGVIEVPTSAVSALPPATYGFAPTPTKPEPAAPANPSGRSTPPQS